MMDPPFLIWVTSWVFILRVMITIKIISNKNYILYIYIYIQELYKTSSSFKRNGEFFKIKINNKVPPEQRFSYNSLISL